MENSMEIPQKIKNRTTIQSRNSLPNIYLKIMKTLIPKGICTLKFMAALFTVAKIWKQPKCPSTDEWIKKMWHIYIYIYEVEYCSAIERMKSCHL